MGINYETIGCLRSSERISGITTPTYSESTYQSTYQLFEVVVETSAFPSKKLEICPICGDKLELKVRGYAVVYGVRLFLILLLIAIIGLVYRGYTSNNADTSNTRDRIVRGTDAQEESSIVNSILNGIESSLEIICGVLFFFGIPIFGFLFNLARFIIWIDDGKHKLRSEIKNT